MHMFHDALVSFAERRVIYMEKLSRDLLRVSRKAQICVGAVVKKYNITVAEEPFFMAINSHDGSTQEELTALVGVDKAMTTRVIHSLESKGLVKRVQDAKDKRQNRIYKTDKVNEISEIVLRDLLQLNQIFTTGIDSDDLDNFMRTLAVLEDNISNFLKEEQ
jgi:DNA-binding MarR family transcriptional regulator